MPSPAFWPPPLPLASSRRSRSPHSSYKPQKRTSLIQKYVPYRLPLNRTLSEPSLPQSRARGALPPSTYPDRPSVDSRLQPAASPSSPADRGPYPLSSDRHQPASTLACLCRSTRTPLPSVVTRRSQSSPPGCRCLRRSTRTPRPHVLEDQFQAVKGNQDHCLGPSACFVCVKYNFSIKEGDAVSSKMNHHYSITIVFLLLMFSMLAIFPNVDGDITIGFPTLVMILLDFIFIFSPLGLACDCNIGLVCKFNTSHFICALNSGFYRYLLLFVAVANVAVAGAAATLMVPWHAACVLDLIAIFSNILFVSAIAN